MHIQFHKNFEKRFRKLPPKLKKKAIVSLKKFTKNPFDPLLRNHSLTGRLDGKRAFSVTGDVRIIFEEFDHYTSVVMFDIGTHAQVYN